MRIVLAHQIAWQTGGAETYLAQLIDWLCRDGHECLLIVEGSLEAEHGSQVKPIVEGEQVKVLSLQESDQEGILRRVRDWGTEIIFVNSLQEPSLESALQMLGRAVRFIHSYEADCLNGSRFHTRPEIGMCSHRFGMPCLVRYFTAGCGHNNLPVTRGRLREVRKKYRREMARQKVLRAYSQVVVMSSFMAQRYRNLGVANVMTAFDEFRPAVDEIVNAPSPAGTSPSPKRAVHLLFLSRHEESKGGQVLLDALPILRKVLARNVHLTMANLGPKSGEWQLQAAEVARECPGVEIHFPGWKDAAGVRALIAESDLLVVPSLWPEPFGLVGVEASREGCPVVAFDRGGISEWLKEGFNGYLAASDPPSPDNLADAIIRCFRDPETLPRFRRQSPQIGRHFELPRHFEKLLRLFRELSDSGRQTIE